MCVIAQESRVKLPFGDLETPPSHLRGEGTAVIRSGNHLQPAWSIYPTLLGRKHPPSPPNSQMQRSGARFTVTDSIQPRHLQKKGKCDFPMRMKGNSNLMKGGPTAAHQRSLVAGSRSPRAFFLRLILKMLPAQRVCRLP